MYELIYVPIYIYIHFIIYTCLCSAYTMQLLLQCKHYASRELSAKRRKNFTFTEIGKAAGGWIGKWSVDVCTLFTNVGVCAGYTVFIASNLQVSRAYKYIYMYMYCIYKKRNNEVYILIAKADKLRSALIVSIGVIAI